MTPTLAWCRFHLHFTSEWLLRRYSFGKKFQSQNLSRENLCKTLSYKKGAQKMLMNLTTVVLFTHRILLTLFLQLGQIVL